MYRFLITVLSIYIFSIFNVCGQSLISEFPLSNRIGNIQAFTSGDNIYLLYEYNTNSDLAQKICQVKADGTSNELPFKHIENAVLVAIRDDGDNIWFYYLAGKKSDVILKIITYNQKTHESILRDEEFPISDWIIGLSNDANALSLISYDKELNKLKIRGIDRSNILYDKSFSIPIDLSRNYKNISYIDDLLCASVEQGAAKFKLYKEDKWLVMTADKNFREGHKDSVQTVVMKFNLEDGSQSITKMGTNVKMPFSSFAYRDTLYRTFMSRDFFKYQVLNISTGDLIKENVMARSEALKTMFVYKRTGKVFRIMKKEPLYKMMLITMDWEPSVIAFSANAKSQTTVLWGTYYPDKNGLILAPFSPITLLASLAVTGLMQFKKPTDLSRYFYTNDKPEFGSAKGNSIKENIDNYEISLDEKRVFFKYKTYFSFQNRPVGLYYNERTLNLKLVRF